MKNREKQSGENNGKSSRQLWDNIKRSKIHNIEVSQKEEKEIHTEQLSKEQMAENLANLVEDVKLEIQEAQDKLNKNYTQTHHNQFPKNQR